MDERQWVHAIQKGDKRYLQDIAEKYYDDIFRFCAFQTGSREDAYDMAQETFLRFIRYVEGYHDRNLKGYLLTIAMNVCRDYLRRKGREDAVTVRCGEEWQWVDAAAADPGSARRRRRDTHSAPVGTEWRQETRANVPIGQEWRKGTGTEAPVGTEWRKETGTDAPVGTEWHQGTGTEAPVGTEWRQGTGTEAPVGQEWRKETGTEAPVGGGRKGDSVGASRAACGQGASWTSGMAEAAGNREADPERHAVEEDVHRRLMQALAQLPDMQREAILLHYLYDMKYREIGRLTQASVSTVKSRVRQGIERLQGILRREDFLD